MDILSYFNMVAFCSAVRFNRLFLLLQLLNLSLELFNIPYNPFSQALFPPPHTFLPRSPISPLLSRRVFNYVLLSRLLSITAPQFFKELFCLFILSYLFNLFPIFFSLREHLHPVQDSSPFLSPSFLVAQDTTHDHSVKSID